MIRAFLWRLLATLLSHPTVARWLISRAQRTVYKHIGPDTDRYMGRWWLFNPYDLPGGPRWPRWLPSIRVHNICREDSAAHPHNHPFEARTIILRGFYIEDRWQDGMVAREVRTAGDTFRIGRDDFHHIRMVSQDLYTLFFTWDYVRDDWGFRVARDLVVPHGEYGGAQREREVSPARTVVFSAPQGWGKPKMIGTLMRMHKCVAVVDEWSPADGLRSGHLHLTNAPPAELHNLSALVVHQGW